MVVPDGSVGNLETTGLLDNLSYPQRWLVLEMRADMESCGGPIDASSSELAPEL